MVGNGWEMVGLYSTYVLQAGAFPAGALFLFLQPLFIQRAFWYVFIIKLPFYNSPKARICPVPGRDKELG